VSERGIRRRPCSFDSVISPRDLGKSKRVAQTRDFQRVCGLGLVVRGIIWCRSRLRRRVLSDRFFFLSCRVLPPRRDLSESEFAGRARVVQERRKLQGFLLNPVKAGRVSRPEDWKGSSGHDDTGTWGAPTGTGSPIPADRIPLPTDPRTRI
jgi:hypothetical protein